MPASDSDSMAPPHAGDESDFGPVQRGRTRPWSRRPLRSARGRGGGRRGGLDRRPSVGGLRLLTRAVVVVLVAVTLVVVLALASLVALSARLDRQQVAGLQPSQPTTILVTGSDTRAGLTPEQRRELTTGSEGGDLTDTIFLLQADGRRSAMLAFPRDLLVTRCDGSVGRINAAVAVDGPGCLVETITRMSGIPISHHVEVRFLGFRDIVEAVGGVEVCLDRPITDRDSGLDLPAGCQTLDGPDALGFVRVRKIDNDLERIKRQQQFVKALAREVVSPATVANPVRLARTAITTADAVTVDQQTGPADLAGLAWDLRAAAAGLDNAYTVPGTDAVAGGASVLRVDEAAAAELFTAFREGALLAADDEQSVAPEVRRGDVRVTVLNGAGVRGRAGRAAEALRVDGFQVTDVGNTQLTAVTEVRHPPGLDAQARLVAERAPGQARVVLDDTARQVTLVLGTDAADG